MRIKIACMTIVVSATVMALSLEEGFRTPPPSARPHTWYHMMNGNVTKEGITCDFEAIAKVGLGGVQMFDAGCDIPPGSVAFNTPEWFDLFEHAQKEAKRLGLEICIPNCSGWSSSGGPWNPPANGMKVVVTSEVSVKGPLKFREKLPREKKDHGFYEDIAVLAYPTPRPGAAIASIRSKSLRSFGRWKINPKTGLWAFYIEEILPYKDAGFAEDQLVREDSQIDLTSRMSADGTLDWDVPDGEWTILRIGYICNGKCNHPASENGKGLEVDKLSASAMDFHFSQYVERLCRTLGINAKTDNTTGFNNILVDSYEVDCQNWTQGLDMIFEKRIGYSIKPYLPVFAGRVVGSQEKTERFLEDFRRLIADLFAENYAGRLIELCHKNGLMCSIEPYGTSPADDLQYGQDVDIPMAEFWSAAAEGNHNGDTGNSRKAAAIAHVWGRRYAATESFTATPRRGGRWCTTPFTIKSQGDSVFADGINRIIYHRFTHQPWPGKKYLPGMTMGRWGMHLDRTQTWWDLAGDWFKYQTRCQWMLQEGVFNADVLYFCGEHAPNDASIPKDMHVPYGYDWDICATKALLALKVVNGRIVVPGGVSYRLLALPPSKIVSEKVLEKIGELIDAGAKVCCTAKPERAPGLRGYPQSDERVRSLASSVWNKGMLTCSPAEALKAIAVQPDFASPQKSPAPRFIHRNNESADWYFVALNNVRSTRFECSFRQTGRIPEIWDALTGEVRPADVWREENDRTFVTFEFQPSGSAFVVFRKPAAGNQVERVTVKPSRRAETVQRAVEPNPAKDDPFAIVMDKPFDWEWYNGVLTAWQPLVAEVRYANGEVKRLSANPPPEVRVCGSWKVAFPEGWSAPKSVEFPELVSWTSRPEDGIKYFSGTATYAKKVALPSLSKGNRLFLDLGDVRNFAEVAVNGRSYPVLWKPPFRVDITDAVKGKSEMELTVKVTNLWANRLIGDDRLFADDCKWKGKICDGVKEIGIVELPKWVKEGKKSPTLRHTFTTWKHWSKDDSLLPSGMLGPVKLRVSVPAE